MNELSTRRVLINESDLSVCADVVNARMMDSEMEKLRADVVCRLVESALTVEHAIRRQSRIAMVNAMGSKGSNDLGSATGTLFEALYVFASSVREISARFGETQEIMEVQPI